MTGAAGHASRRELAALIAGGLLARLPLVMVSLSLVLLVRDVGHGYSTVGAVSGAYIVASGLASPLLGRISDRLGPTPVLLGAAAVSAASLAVIAAAADALGGPGLVLAAAVAGCAVPPVTAVLRALLPRVADPTTLRTLYGLEAAFQETLFVAGPVVVVAVVAVASPAWALAACAVLVCAGTLGFALLAHRRAAPPAPAGRGSALRAAGLRWLALVYGCIGVSFGAVELATIGALDDEGHRDLAGLVLAAWAFGSLVGGVLVTRRTRGEPEVRLPRLLALLAALSVPLAVAARDPRVLAAALLVQGVAIAPALGTIYELVPRVARATVLTEAFAWTTSAVYAGVAAGNVLAGQIIAAAGPAQAFALAVLAPALGALCALRVSRNLLTV